MTFSDAMERAEREWLEPPEKQECGQPDPDLKNESDMEELSHVVNNICRKRLPGT